MPRTNLLDSRAGRLATFSLLYLGEGLPQGFATAAVVLELKRMGMATDELGAFAATIMLPWAWKWCMGPIVDNVHLRRFGRRSQWVLAMQTGMIATLLAALAAFPKEGAGGLVGLGAFTTLLLAHNVFAACQDVAIDAMAVTTLSEEERGRANGLMFGAAQLGMAIGGSGVIALKGVFGFSFAALVVPMLLLTIFGSVLVWVREPIATDRSDARGLGYALRAILDYARTVAKVFFTTRRGLLGLALALLPLGAKGLSLTISNVVSPTLGMTDDEIATFGLASSVLFAITCAMGGVVSDRFGRKRTLGLFAAATVLPTLWVAWRFSEAGFLVPPPAPEGGVWPRADEAVVWAWIAAGFVYAALYGLMYGVQSALYMDIVEPAIAATQFTASMALLNLVTVYGHWWQGKALATVAEGGWGLTVPQALGVDAALGLLFLLVLPFVRTRASEAAERAAA